MALFLRPIPTKNHPIFINGFKFFNPEVSRAPLSCGDNGFCVIRDLSDYIFLLEEALETPLD